MKLCIDCKHHFLKYDDHRCNAPENGANPVTGEVIQRSCDIQRSVTAAVLPGYCGGDALFFQGIEVVSEVTQ